MAGLGASERAGAQRGSIHVPAFPSAPCFATQYDQQGAVSARAALKGPMPGGKQR